MSESAARIGHRAFIVDGQSVIPFPQKKFEALHLRGQPALPDFAGRTIQTVLVMYTLRGRKPESVFHVESHRVRIGLDGSLDAGDRRRSIELIAHRLSHDGGRLRRHGNVVEAKVRFDQKEWQDRHSPLPGPVHKKILAEIFDR